MAAKSGFTPEYKKETIKLITERGKKISEVSRDIGVNSTSIHRWIKQYGEYGEDAFPGKRNLRPEDADLREARKRIRDLKEENEILKKAMAIFSKGAR
ncbi:transposase [Thermoanaerobacterium thermosaccharolyticum]|uniref:transposase n=1 Tax=Thermoanaerobacterium thermosaccharolyticum TaxID=1517 RepID=UPI002FD8F955